MLRLGRLFDRLAIKDAVFVHEKDKSLGLHGFTLAAIQDCQDIFNRGLIKNFQQFFETEVFNALY